MRRIISFLAISAFISLSAIQAQEIVNDRDKPRIEGSGNIVTKTFNVQAFDQLNVSGVFTLKLTQGSKEEVRIEADDNLQDLFHVKNEGSALNISMDRDKNIKSKKKLNVYITFRKLRSMDLKLVGDVTSQENLSFDDVSIDNHNVGSVDLKLTAQSVNLTSEGVGNLTLNGRAENAVIKHNSVGSLDAGNFIVQTMDIHNKGIGSASVNAEKSIKVKDSFLGKVSNKGAAPVKRAQKVVI